MTDMTAAILNSAERRIRVGGFNGFSFREVAADVGVKSSSVHYHFPTKEQLAAAVIRRYTAHVAKLIDEGSADGADPLMVWTRAFRSTVHSKNRMCPAAVLGAGALDLPPEVALALALIRRVRELAVGIPGLIGWQILESRRAWSARSTSPAQAVKAPVGS